MARIQYESKCDEERRLMKDANKAHQEDNARLNTANKILREAFEEMYSILVDDVPNGFTHNITQEQWDRWEAIMDKEPIQLRLL